MTDSEQRAVRALARAAWILQHAACDSPYEQHDRQFRVVNMMTLVWNDYTDWKEQRLATKPTT